MNHWNQRMARETKLATTWRNGCAGRRIGTGPRTVTPTTFMGTCSLSGPELSEAYEYTPEGLLRSAVSGGMRYSYAYDAMGRLIGKTASGRKLLSLEYDLNGNLVRQTDVTGKVTEYRYDLTDQLLQVLDDGKAVAEYAYYPDGLVKSLKNGESLYTEYAYDNDKNLSLLRTRLGSETLAENHYRYDGNGSRTEKRQREGTILYHYDSQNRLRMTEYPGYKEELFYDKAGNRTRRLTNSQTRYECDWNGWCQRLSTPMNIKYMGMSCGRAKAK